MKFTIGLPHDRVAPPLSLRILQGQGGDFDFRF